MIQLNQLNILIPLS